MEKKTTKEIIEHIPSPHYKSEHWEKWRNTEWVRVEDIIQEIIDFGCQEKSLFDFYVHLRNELSQSSEVSNAKNN